MSMNSSFVGLRTKSWSLKEVEVGWEGLNDFPVSGFKDQHKKLNVQRQVCIQQVWLLPQDFYYHCVTGGLEDTFT